MDSRRTRRNPLDAEATRSRRVAKSSPPRKSPAVRKSPARKSPARKSPARKKSPVRETAPAARGRPKRNQEPTIVLTKNEALSKISPKTTDTKTVLKISLSPVDKKYGETNKKITKTTSTTSTTRVKVESLSNNKNSDSVDLAKVATTYREAVKEKLERLSQRLTPTPSGSRRTDSRSVSHSAIDDERLSRSEEYSDTEKEPEYKSFEKYKPTFNETKNSYLHRPDSRNFLSKPEFGGNMGAFILILFWCLGGFFIQFICTRQLCDWNINRVQKLKLLATYINMEAGVLYIAYTWSIIILSAIPIGSIVRLSDRNTSIYIFNGFLSAITTIAAIIIAEHYDYPALKIITRNYQRLLSISLINAITLSVWFYIRSKYVPLYQQNLYARNGKFLCDFFIGKEINPQWFDIINIKLVLYRISIITTLIFNGIFVYKNLQFSPLPEFSINGTSLTWTEIGLHTYNTIVFDPIALLIAGLIIIYILDLLIFESHLASSFELQGEGVGACLLIRYALYPHLTSLIAKYTLEHPIKGIPNWILALIGILFMVGLCLKRGSNRIKHQYRLNPSANRFLNMETISTFQGRRLLVASYWSKLRQPNYLGDMICTLSLLIPLIWRFAWPPLIASLFTIVFLIHRAKRVNIRNENRYESSWTRYRSQVKYMLVPYIF